MRDPRLDPREGDVLYEAGGPRELHVDRVTDGEVGYRVTEGRGLLAAFRVTREHWLRAAASCSLEPWRGEEAEPCD